MLEARFGKLVITAVASKASAKVNTSKACNNIYADPILMLSHVVMMSAHATVPI